MPLVGEVTLTEAKVIELAGGAAEGAIAHVGVTATATDVPGIGGFRTEVRRDLQAQADPRRDQGLYRRLDDQIRHRDGRRVRRRSVRRQDARPVPEGGGPSEDPARHLLGRTRRDVPSELHGPGQERRAGRDRHRSRPTDHLHGRGACAPRPSTRKDAPCPSSCKSCCPVWRPAPSTRWSRSASPWCGRQPRPSTSPRASSSCCRPSSCWWA